MCDEARRRSATALTTLTKPNTLAFGDLSSEEYYRIRREHVHDRWLDGAQRMIDAEKQQFSVLWEDHRDAVAEYRRQERIAHRQRMADFEWLCAGDKTNDGLAMEEEDTRRELYERWLQEYLQLLPAENAYRNARIAQQKHSLQAHVAAASRRCDNRHD